MNTSIFESAQSTLGLIVSQSLESFSSFLPQLLGALLIIILGSALAKTLRRVVVKVLKGLRISAMFEKTPVEHFLTNAEIGHKLEEVIGSVFYWLIMLVVLQTTAAVLGLDALSSVFDQVLHYIPSVFSAVLVLFLGVLLAGVIESLVKGSIKSVDGKAARLLGKISSYLVISIVVLIAISELHIAKDYILILFIGFIMTISLGFGLALGLGGKNVVGKMLDEWYEKMRDEVKRN